MSGLLNIEKFKHLKLWIFGCTHIIYNIHNTCSRFVNDFRIALCTVLYCIEVLYSKV